MKDCSGVKVSVCVITYNHQEYIGECLRSILNQRLDYEFEVIVADDCSSDNTRFIIDEFAKAYPGLVKRIYHKKNIGICANYYSAHSAALGEYVAHCDGDDYWYSGKLKSQVNILDNDLDVVQCWTCADIVNDSGQVIGVFPSKSARKLYPTTISAKNIALSYALVGQHSTQMYRKSAKKKIDKDEYLDYWVAFNISLSGKSVYIKSVLGAYRSTKRPSVTRNKSKKRVSVDLLAVHLHEIVKKFPEYAFQAKANMFCRYLFSKIKGHDVAQIKAMLWSCCDIRLKYSLLAKSSYYFILQKLK